jgi:hypothetical protein
MVTELTNKVVKPRKRHRCDWCCEWCEPGEPAHYRVSIFDGDFCAGYLHPECHEAMVKSDWSEYEEFTPGDQKRGKTMDESHA